jgi:hypothetical protein
MIAETFVNLYSPSLDYAAILPVFVLKLILKVGVTSLEE